MLNIENSIKLELTCADIPSILRKLNGRQVALRNIQCIDLLTIRFDIRNRDFNTVQQVLRKQDVRISIVERKGIQNIISALYRRPVMSLFILIIVSLSLFLPTRVLFVESVGTDSLADQYVIEKAAECGVHIGASRRAVRSEQMKNKLLAAIPQLQWAGVNTNGCVAVIFVEEKRIPEYDNFQSQSVGNVVAAQDGIISSCIVQCGTQLCRLGQAVKTGEILVSGYTDCGIALQATCAEAEIKAKTLRSLDVVTPSKMYVRSGVARYNDKISLQIGKKLINLFKDSGICGTSCVKMYQKKYLTLPGGRHLPVAVIVEQHMHYSGQMDQLAIASAEENVVKMAEQYLLSQMIAGEIKRSQTEISYINDCCQLIGRYSCTETISKVVYEGRIDIHG